MRADDKSFILAVVTTAFEKWSNERKGFMSRLAEQFGKDSPVYKLQGQFKKFPLPEGKSLRVDISFKNLDDPKSDIFVTRVIDPLAYALWYQIYAVADWHDGRLSIDDNHDGAISIVWKSGAAEHIATTH